MSKVHLVAMAGLPGSGKSTIADALSRALPAMIISVDPIEAAIRRSGLQKDQVGTSGYLVAEAVAIQNLQLGYSVIIDAVNPVQGARDMWSQVAKDMSVPLTVLEVMCSDPALHQRRIEARVRGIAGLTEVDWVRVQARRQEYEPWSAPRHVLDTAHTSVANLVTDILDVLKRP